MYRKYLLIAVFLMMAALFVSCNTDKNVSTDVSTAVTIQTTDTKTYITTKTTIDMTTGDTTADNNVPLMPSQSVGTTDDFLLPADGIRPIAVMIDNEGSRSLPQGGLDKAQIIYEVIIEGGETRLMPVFWNTNVQMIGPVRSSRHYFLDYAMEYDAIYVHFGWSPMAQKDISKLKINNINGVTYGGKIFWSLTNNKGNWQDSYTSMQKIINYIKEVKYRTNTDKKPVFTYNQSDLALINGQKADKISIGYSSSYTCGYEYDSASGFYMRLRKGVPHMERVSGKQLVVKNIIIQYTKNSAIKGDDKGRQELNTVGSGKGYYITDGNAIKIKWSKSSRNAQTQYTDGTGNTIVLNPGQTWVQVVPISGKVSVN